MLNWGIGVWLIRSIGVLLGGKVLVWDVALLSLNGLLGCGVVLLGLLSCCGGLIAHGYQFEFFFQA